VPSLWTLIVLGLAPILLALVVSTSVLLISVRRYEILLRCKAGDIVDEIDTYIRGPGTQASPGTVMRWRRLFIELETIPRSKVMQLFKEDSERLASYAHIRDASTRALTAEEYEAYLAAGGGQ